MAEEFLLREGNFGLDVERGKESPPNGSFRLTLPHRRGGSITSNTSPKTPMSQNLKD
ncbi:MAG: hypothetical protein ACOC44_13135 [Promethearchaeia archaeon]